MGSGRETGRGGRFMTGNYHGEVALGSLESAICRDYVSSNGSRDETLTLQRLENRTPERETFFGPLLRKSNIDPAAPLSKHTANRADTEIIDYRSNEKRSRRRLIMNNQFGEFVNHCR